MGGHTRVWDGYFDRHVPLTTGPVYILATNSSPNPVVPFTGGFSSTWTALPSHLQSSCIFFNDDSSVTFPRILASSSGSVKCLCYVFSGGGCSVSVLNTLQCRWEFLHHLSLWYTLLNIYLNNAIIPLAFIGLFGSWYLPYGAYNKEPGFISMFNGSGRTVSPQIGLLY